MEYELIVLGYEHDRICQQYTFQSWYPITVLLLSISPRKYEGHCFLLFRERESLMNKSLGYNRQGTSLQEVKKVVHPRVILSVCICLCMYVCPFLSLCLCVCINLVLDEVNEGREERGREETSPNSAPTWWKEMADRYIFKHKIGWSCRSGYDLIFVNTRNVDFVANTQFHTTVTYALSRSGLDTIACKQNCLFMIVARHHIFPSLPPQQQHFVWEIR